MRSSRTYGLTHDCRRCLFNTNTLLGDAPRLTWERDGNLTLSHTHTRTDGDACRTHLVPSSHGRSHHTSLSWSRSPFIFLRGPAGVGICAAKRKSTGTSSEDTAPWVRGRPAGKNNVRGLVWEKERSKELRQEGDWREIKPFYFSILNNINILFFLILSISLTTSPPPPK
jgi:hypothetical protein